ncbi:hypothetical protein C2E23DRAFT_807236 [Lenzites betulinus]|nr:hypothetical protein C2E23DRAFT_807236 [Lenzites betulinus]
MTVSPVSDERPWRPRMALLSPPDAAPLMVCLRPCVSRIPPCALCCLYVFPRSVRSGALSVFVTLFVCLSFRSPVCMSVCLSLARPVPALHMCIVVPFYSTRVRAAAAALFVSTYSVILIFCALRVPLRLSVHSSIPYHTYSFRRAPLPPAVPRPAPASA